MVLSDAFITQETFVDGANVTFKCAIGYASTGRSPPVTCTAGVWSEVKLKCESNIIVYLFLFWKVVPYSCKYFQFLLTHST